MDILRLVLVVVWLFAMLAGASAQVDTPAPSVAPAVTCPHFDAEAACSGSSAMARDTVWMHDQGLINDAEYARLYELYSTFQGHARYFIADITSHKRAMQLKLRSREDQTYAALDAFRREYNRVATPVLKTNIHLQPYHEVEAPVRYATAVPCGNLCDDLGFCLKAWPGPVPVK